MSVISGGSGSPIKSVQRGSVSVAGTPSVTIAAVDMSKSFVTVEQNHNTDNVTCTSRAELLSSTSLQFSNGTGTATVKWQVIEYV